MDQFIGEIRLFAFPRVPDGWLPCNGSLQSIAAFQALYALIGTTFGGDGSSTFGLPDLRGRVPISQGTGGGLSTRSMGQTFGETAHTLTTAEMAAHSHALLSTTNAGTTPTPSPSVHLAASNDATTVYAPAANVTAYAVMAQSINAAGQNNAHDNMMPTLTANFCIATDGIYPQQS